MGPSFNCPQCGKVFGGGRARPRFHYGEEDDCPLGKCGHSCYQRAWRLSRRLKQRTCEVCATVFTTTRRDARFCSNVCRQKAHRKTSLRNDAAEPVHASEIGPRSHQRVEQTDAPTSRAGRWRPGRARRGWVPLGGYPPSRRSPHRCTSLRVEFFSLCSSNRDQNRGK
jgi:hypothetical protein